MSVYNAAGVRGDIMEDQIEGITDKEQAVILGLTFVCTLVSSVVLGDTFWESVWFFSGFVSAGIFCSLLVKGLEQKK